MLTRVHIKGYKSLSDVEVRLEPLTLLLGPNASGKSNFLDSLQLLSKLATGRTLKAAFDPPHRGLPLESFSLGDTGIKGLVAQERLVFAIEADLRVSDAVVQAVDRQIREMRRPSGEGRPAEAGTTSVRERELRYRIEIEMSPRSGILRVSDEYLAALNSKGDPTGRRRPFIERQGETIHLRPEGQAPPIRFDRHLDRTILSMPHYPPHSAHLTAARHELERWRFFYFDPRERMRAANPVKEVGHLGQMGEELAAVLNTLKAGQPRQFNAMAKALRTLLPEIDGIEVEVSDLGEVELRLKEGGLAIPARVMSEGTLRMLGLLALRGADESPSLVGFEEPENGVHPRRIALIAELLRTRSLFGPAQYIVTTHSPILADLLPDESLFAVRRIDRATRIDPFSAWGSRDRRRRIGGSPDEFNETLPVSERILRGDFDA